MIGEAKTITEVRKKLIDKYLDASPEDRLRLRQDIEMAERDLRQLGIYHKAIGYVPDNQSTVSSTSTIENLDPPPEFKAWLDTFNDYARKQNEPWRSELLARALALESETLGIIGQRALWFIGTVDEREFHAFAAILDIATNILGSYVIPNHQPFISRQIPNYAHGENNQMGQALFMISNLGLFGDLSQSQRTAKEGVLLISKYGSREVVATVKQEVAIRGVLLTALGDTIAKLYGPRTNELGLEIFNTWIDSLRSGQIEIIKEI